MTDVQAHRVQPTPELLRQAAAVLRERGLSRGKFKNPNTGAVCMLGACAVAADLRDPDEGGYMHPVYEYLATVLEGERGLVSGFVATTVFNDKARDVEEVAQFLELAAEALG